MTEHEPEEIEAQVVAVLKPLRREVLGMVGSLVATTDGLLIAQDLHEDDPTRVAALTATTLGLAEYTTQAVGCGGFREAVIRGESGYFVVYSAGGRAVLAVVGNTDLNVAMLHLQTRSVVATISELSVGFARFHGS